MPEERRKFVRIKKDLSARYSYDVNKDEKKWDMTMIKDISVNGMVITTHRQFLPNDILTVHIKIPLKPLEWIELNGRVVVSGGIKTTFGESVAGSYITRVEFMNLEAEDKELIQEYVRWFLSKGGGTK